ncbi:hypothetical protein BWQ96_10398 [Gracilariopsis chorda]|uniref:Uncharacterized protein n=1 Tax=Gracilariopsis chorda TaxID=448386 RepID=A0A2V3ICX2_9FLOR|nr:hypothetical protein BWQ96_10398 [Gracilariopsis chorda]|eukprot:PXF39888.1 hypothetical protein BWQ96_10398 [Gracilariopsis chorda]
MMLLEIGGVKCECSNPPISITNIFYPQIGDLWTVKVPKNPTHHTIGGNVKLAKRSFLFLDTVDD